MPTGKNDTTLTCALCAERQWDTAKDRVVPLHRTHFSLKQASLRLPPSDNHSGICKHELVEARARNVVRLAAVHGRSEDAAGLRVVGLVKKVEAAITDHSVRALVPSCYREPAVLGGLEKTLSHARCFARVALVAKEGIHVLRIDWPISWNHVDEPSTTVPRLVHRREVSRLVGRLTEEFLDGDRIATLPHCGEHGVEGICPFLRTVIAKLVAAGPWVGLGLRRVALGPVAAVVVDTLEDGLRHTCGAW